MNYVKDLTVVSYEYEMIDTLSFTCVEWMTRAQ